MSQGSTVSTNMISESRIITGDGDDVISIISGTSISVDAGDGNDSIYNGKLYSFIIAGDGDDSIFNQKGRDSTIISGNGNDTIRNDRGSNVLIYSGAGNDTVYNLNSPNVTLEVGDGNDTILNQANNALVYLGTGNDVFVFKSGTATIFDFGIGDIISLYSNISNSLKSDDGYSVTFESGTNSVTLNRVMIQGLSVTSSKINYKDFSGDDTINISSNGFYFGGVSGNGNDLFLYTGGNASKKPRVFVRYSRSFCFHVKSVVVVSS